MSGENVLIAGAGPVGLVVALGLARQGIDVTVLERDTRVGSSPRALVHFPPVLAGFAQLGVLEDADREGYRLAGMNHVVYATGEQIYHGGVAWNGIDLQPLTLGQDKLTVLLMRHLGSHPNATIHRGAAVTGVTQDEGGVVVDVEGLEDERQSRSSWLIGADGARSTVREALGLGFEGITWPERFVATNIRYDFEAHGYKPANFVLDSEHGAIVVRIDDADLWRYTYSEDASLPVDSTLERLPARLANALPGPGDYQLVDYAPYRMHQRAAENFRSGRVLLAGDAAHATNPTGGLGLTGGLLDAFSLAEALGAVISGAAEQDVLDRYAEARRNVFLNLTSPMASEFKRLVFDAAGTPRFDQDLAILREIADSEELRRQRLEGMSFLATPPLVDAEARAS